MFFIVESKHTFTGISKQAVFYEHMNEPRFERFQHKIVHYVMPAPAPNTPPFDYEADHRRAMTKLINEHIAADSSSYTDGNPALVIMADVDELPSAQTISLLKGCEGWGSVMHLSLRTFLYSYEWELPNTASWKAAVRTWVPSQYYGHSVRTGKGEAVALADSGWHCR
jgi:beta-1,4-mannosyl-glycoprotein beta-1,4-N-acetylglucosaminyltransferase